MNDWKKRFKKEYYELRERFIRLEYMVSEYEKGTLKFKPNCPIDLLKSQLSVMYSYLYILQERVKIEGIKL